MPYFGETRFVVGLRVLRNVFYWFQTTLLSVHVHISEKDRQGAYNVTLRCVLVTTVAMEKQWSVRNLCVCVRSLSYPACNSHTLYCHLLPAQLYNIFPHYLINVTIFEKQLRNIKCVFLFSIQLLSETFFILRITEGDIIKNVCWSSCKVPVIRVRF